MTGLWAYVVTQLKGCGQWLLEDLEVDKNLGCSSILCLTVVELGLLYNLSRYLNPHKCPLPHHSLSSPSICANPTGKRSHTQPTTCTMAVHASLSTKHELNELSGQYTLSQWSSFVTNMNDRGMWGLPHPFVLVHMRV